MPFSNWKIEFGKRLGPLVLGQPRVACIQGMKQAGVDVEDDNDGIEYFFVFEDDLELELNFAEAEPNVLRQIIIEKTSILFDGMPLLGTTLDQALLAIGFDSFDDTLWRMDGDPSDSLPENIAETDAEITSATSAELIESGTLWLRSLAVGFRIRRGLVNQIVLRKLEDAPAQGLGPLLPRHLELALQQEVPKPEEAAAASGSVRDVPALAKAPYRWANFVVQCVTALVATFLIYRAVTFQKRWSEAALRVEGKVISIIEHDPVAKQDLYVVEYFDADQKPHTARWTIAEIYVARKVGETVQVTYLPESPDQPASPMRAGDIVFDTFFPWGVAVVGTYIVLNMLIAFFVR